MMKRISQKDRSKVPLASVADRSFLVANAQQGLCHIIYCSDGFCRLTGFSRAEVMQRPAVCDFLHGPMTSPHAVAALRDALAAGVEKHFEILYYRKDGEYCLLIVPIDFCPMTAYVVRQIYDGMSNGNLKYYTTAVQSKSLA